MLRTIDKLSRINFNNKWLIVLLAIFGFLHLNINHSVGSDVLTAWLADNCITAYLLLSWISPLTFGILLTLFLWRSDAALTAVHEQNRKGQIHTDSAPLWRKLLHIVLDAAMLLALLWTFYRLILLAAGVIQWFTTDRHWYESITSKY